MKEYCLLGHLLLKPKITTHNYEINKPKVISLISTDKKKLAHKRVSLMFLSNNQYK